MGNSRLKKTMITNQQYQTHQKIMTLRGQLVELTNQLFEQMSKEELLDLELKNISFDTQIEKISDQRYLRQISIEDAEKQIKEINEQKNKAVYMSNYNINDLQEFQLGLLATFNGINRCKVLERVEKDRKERLGIQKKFK